MTAMIIRLMDFRRPSEGSPALRPSKGDPETVTQAELIHLFAEDLGR